MSQGKLSGSPAGVATGWLGGNNFGGSGNIRPGANNIPTSMSGGAPGRASGFNPGTISAQLPNSPQPQQNQGPGQSSPTNSPYQSGGFNSFLMNGGGGNNGNNLLSQLMGLFGGGGAFSGGGGNPFGMSNSN